MKLTVATAIVVIAALVAALLCAYLRAWLERRDILDHPGERSLHDTPVPRGGGLAIAAVVVAGGATGWLLGGAGDGALPVMLFGGLGFALLGWADDRRSRSVLWRLLVQALLAALVTWLLFAARPAAATLSLPLGVVLTVLLVWHVNLFNFMDGADGFAALQTIASSLASAVYLHGCGGFSLSLLPLVMTGGALGFLYWNRPPARLFLGDSGSYFIGFMSAAVVLHAHVAGVSVAPLLTLLAPFVVDATLTLGGRAVNGERWWKPHRTHLFQRFVLAGWSPARLGVALMLLHVCVCWPLAALSVRIGYAGVFVTYAMLSVAWLILRRRPAPIPNAQS